MNRMIVLLIAFALAAAAVGCSKTIREPGASEHGGVFLYGDPHNAPTTR